MARLGVPRLPPARHTKEGAAPTRTRSWVAVAPAPAAAGECRHRNYMVGTQATKPFPAAPQIINDLQQTRRALQENRWQGWVAA